jgi:diguanylate cyclase (GGDEF)-like protein
VDDEKLNLAVLHRILSPEYTIFTAKSGKDALELAVQNTPDLILLDVIMPDMNGFDVLAKLKENPATREIPVIFITGLQSEENEEKGFLLGAVDYITKPFSNAIVRARVRTHMEIVRQFRVIERLGLVDPLTNIANRRAFDERLAVEWKRAIREKKPLSFLMMDVDKFKTYNDTYGHPQGDVLLRAVAKTFAAAARRPFDMAARLGGEEFGVLLPGASLENALEIAEKIRSDVEATGVPAKDGKIMTSATISIGVVSAAPRSDDGVKDFIAKADAYLYSAKNTGRNKIFSSESEII